MHFARFQFLRLCLVAGVGLALAGCVSDDESDYYDRLRDSGYYDAEGVYHPSNFHLRQDVMIHPGSPGIYQPGTYWYPDGTVRTYPYYTPSHIYRTDPRWDQRVRENDRREGDHPDDRVRDRDQRREEPRRDIPRAAEPRRDEPQRDEPRRDAPAREAPARAPDRSEINTPNKSHMPDRPAGNRTPPPSGGERQRTR